MIQPFSASFPAMGTTCRVIITGGNEALLDSARRRVDELESKWSRFREDSEITRLNRRSGRATGLSADSFLLVDHAVAAWRATAGRYDPTVLHALEAAGYDRSFELVQAGDLGGKDPGRGTAETAAGNGAGQPAPGCGAVVFDTSLRTVTFPDGVGFDPGGIGKGLAADLVVDLLLDPRTGASIDTTLDAVTVIARDAWMAEVLTKAAYVAGIDQAPALVTRLGGSALLVENTRRLIATAGFMSLLIEDREPAAVG